MTWVLLGGRGMLGRDLQQVLADANQPFRALGSAECDVRDADAVTAAVREASVVVNCAAWTAVDNAEAREPDAFAINATGAHNVARATAGGRARLIHISTDYVFDGTDDRPYAEHHPQNPRTAYGRTKAAGEWAVRAADPSALVVRTAWLYGAGGPNFVATMLRLARERDTVRVVADQIGQPTWTRDLADLILRLVESGATGGYVHGTSGGSTSWHGFAQEIFRLAGHDPQRVQPISSAEYPTPAIRPAYSVLGHRDRAGCAPIGEWNDRLAQALEEVDRSGDDRR